MKYKNILFDLDGTIIKSDKGIIKALKLSLEALDIKNYNEEILLKFLGPPLYESYTKYFNLNYEKYNKALAIFQDYYRKKGIFECELYTGILQTIKELKDANYNLFLATSKPEKESYRIIEHFGLMKYFDFIGAADADHGSLRDSKTAVIEYVLTKIEGLNKKEVLMIGDRSYDIVGAKNNDIASMSVLYGYGSKEEFLEYKTDYIVKDTFDIAKFLLSSEHKIEYNKYLEI